MAAKVVAIRVPGGSMRQRLLSRFQQNTLRPLPIVLNYEVARIVSTQIRGRGCPLHLTMRPTTRSITPYLKTPDYWTNGPLPLFGAHTEPVGVFVDPFPVHPARKACQSDL
jgi:hypothetical protein